MYLRGAANAYTVILVNGVPVNDPTGVGGAFDLRMFPVDAIERIEILKGAQSTLYGTDAVAGVINIITKKGMEKPASLYGGISYGRYNTLKAHAGLNGSLGGSSYNISFMHDETGGIAEAKDTLGNQNFPRNGMLRNAASIDIDGAVTDRFHVKPFFRYAYFKSTFANNAFVGGQNAFLSKLLSTGTQAQYSFDKASITGIFSFDDVERQYPEGFVKAYKGNKKTAEIFSRVDWHQYFQTLVGVRYDDITMKDPNPTSGDTSVQMVSPYVSLFLKNWKGFNMEVGGRLNNHSRYGNNFTYSINPSYSISNKLKLFINYGTAFRVPVLSELYGSFGANPELKPEESNTIDGGVQYTTSDEKFDIRVVGFSRNTKNIIAYQNQQYINYNRQKDHGVEIESVIRFTDDIRLKLFYTFTEGEVTTAAAVGDTTYNNLFKRPKHAFGANLGYQVTESFFVSTNFQNFGKRNDLYFESVPPYGQLNVPLTAYSLWDIYGEYTFLNRN
ncbi:TonB-dependent receptor plug domain-containing protein [Niabella ginsengisoli]|uniref:TonB-dependent receptor n=1 Tax=Niabella ginsengisoli TaxID=522298 RepID=A0ABS9SE57_9BACT|nr:TonB-dependent receptor [Niabella ginsengisoli]MCH5596641.1 TonB-dependent receptor [Niabella ginsengisoli]